MDEDEIVEDCLVVDVRDMVALLRRSGHVIVPQSWMTEIVAARHVLSKVSRMATPEEWSQHRFREISGTQAADQLLQAIISDDFVCNYDLADETENFGEGEEDIASDGLPRPQAYGERRCKNIIRAHWEDEDAPRSAYPVFEGVEKECPDSHGLNDDTSNYHDHCIRWMERLTIRRAFMGRNPYSWQLVKPPTDSEPSPPDAPSLRAVDLSPPGPRPMNLR